MSDKRMRNEHVLIAGAAAAERRFLRSVLARAAWVGMVAFLVLGHAASGLAGTVAGSVRFQPAVALLPPVLASRLQGAASATQVAETPVGTLYAATDSAGKARVWLMRNNALAADVTAPGSRDNMTPDWPGSFAFMLGGRPVVAISWKFASGVYGIEDFTFWVAEAGGSYLGGLPKSTRNACSAGEASSRRDCGRCGFSSNIPIDTQLVSVEPDRARFVQKIAANWYYYFGAAAEIFEQDYLLTATGLSPDGSPRRTRHAISHPQAKERVTGLLREYFALAKTQSRPQIAPEFLTCFGQLVDLAPDFGQGHYNVGCMHALLGNHQEAVASVKKAIALDPKYRKVARRDPDLGTVRDDPELIRLLRK
jgi:hypothetical protein